MQLHRVTYCARTSPLPLLPSGPGGVGGITSRRTRHRLQSTIGERETASAMERPETEEEVLGAYRAQRTVHEELLAVAGKRRARALQALLAVVVLVGFVAVEAPRGVGELWPLLLGFAGGVGIVWYLARVGAEFNRGQRLVGFYERSLRRVDGREPQSGRTGLEAGQTLRTEGHLYDRDLDLLGPESLFGLLCTVRTGPGERGLAKYLLEPASHAETLDRQAAVRELAGQTELREKIALLGVTKFHQVAGNVFHDWLGEPVPVFGGWIKPVLAVTALLNVLGLVAGLAHLLPWGTVLPNLLLTLGLQGAICLPLRKRVAPFLKCSETLAQHVKLMTEGLALLQSREFAAVKLQALKQRATEPAGAVETLKKLERQLEIVEQRPKEYFFVFTLLLAAGTQVAISMARWKREYGAAMGVWVEAWAEFETLNALATYAYEHPEDAWPELLADSAAPLIEGENLGHPLLEDAVRNDVSLGVTSREAKKFYLISGSNMAGKSTLLRSVGINVVLAYAGAPVRARGMRLTPLRIGAALALTDSLAEGKSKFKAEVERLAAIVSLGKTGPVLFLVDEIFSGTNSADRRAAAGAVLRSLLRCGAVGALSTHDLALTDLATEASGGVNVHMSSPDDADPLAFDYKLKPGVNTSSNAMAIIRLMGLEMD